MRTPQPVQEGKGSACGRLQQWLQPAQGSGDALPLSVQATGWAWEVCTGL